MQKITPFLWFDDRAEEAARFYVSVFKDGRLGDVSYYGEDQPGPPGGVMTVSFELFGQTFTALNGGPHFYFTPAISFVVDCATQAEVDDLWERLSEGGEKGQCGWLTDKFGLSWQIVPAALGKLMAKCNAVQAGRVMQALLKMTKLEIAGLERAYEGQE